MHSLKRYWTVAQSSSTTYKWFQAFGALVWFGYSLTNFAILDFSDIPGGAGTFLLRSVVESLLFIVVTHLIMRSYLKLEVINSNLNLVGGIKLFLMMVFTSVVNVVLSLKIGEIPFLKGTQPEDFTFLMDGKEVQLSLSDPIMWFFLVSNIFVFILGWTLIYIFWHAAKAKRALQKQMQEARIQQLTNQLSPHFLFNTLNSIRALIYEDRDKAADLVTQLSEIFRTNLQAHLQPSATLEQEWQVAQRYLTIEQARLEERLAVTCDIDDELWQQKLPTLCLLTLIENAIKHGVSPNPEPGFIDIQAHLENESEWRLTIRNSAIGEHISEGTQTGLKNTKDRLGLMFGAKMKFRAVRKGNEFVVSIEVPFD